MRTFNSKPARFQLRIQDFYVLAALNFIGTAICSISNQPHIHWP